MGFKKNFAWGTATAAYQIEGAYREDGKGVSIWDVYSHEPGKTDLFHNGDTACDHYHRYKEDIALMVELGITSYRFSIAWTRIMPDGVGEINQKGVDFYNALIDELIKNNIEPCVTLYHWDLPYELLKRGGWLSPDMPSWFEHYAEVCGKLFGDRVKKFITINEPQCVIGLGYHTLEHAPGIRVTLKELLAGTHIIMLAHGRAVMALRRTVKNVKIGYSPCGDVFCPATNDPADIEAARKAYFSFTREGYNPFNTAIYSDPVMLGDYPKEYYEMFSDILPDIKEGDFDIISQPIDFYGQNIYNGKLVRAGKDGNPEIVPFPVGMPMTTMGWYVVPEALYWGPKFLYERYGKPIVISENGMACTDWVAKDGKVHDGPRVDFLDRYISELKRAASDGVDIDAYYCWSLMDNFEWKWGYTRRFGLVHVDYTTQKRTPKDSFYFYKEVVATNGNNLK